MNTIKLSEKSWHYHLATHVAGLVVYRNDELDGCAFNMDLCSYGRAVFKGILISLFMVVLGVTLGYILMNMFMALGFSIAYGMFIYGDLAFIGWAVVIVGGSISGFGYVSTKIINWLQRRNENKPYEAPTPDSFLKEQYKAFKGKYCAKIRFVE